MISHVAELRFYDLTDEQAAGLAKSVEATLQARGCTSEQVELHFHTAEVKFQWNQPKLGDDKPSESQLYYARKLYKDLSTKSQLSVTPLGERAKQLASDVVAEMTTGNITKRLMSPIIDAMKEAIADLDFERQGIRKLED